MKSVFPPPEAQSESDRSDDPILLQTLRFVYHHLVSLVAVSIGWTFLSLPLVTVGPVTLGAYKAIISLRETGTIDIDDVRSTVRSNLLSSTLLGLLPPVFVSISLAYIVSIPGRTTMLSLGIAVVALYIAVYLGVLLVPTFYEIARGIDPTDALRAGYIWIASNPTTAIRLVFVTVALFVISTLLTVAIVVIFPGFLLSYYVLLAERGLHTDPEP